ncbi:ACH_G0038550.mRNA.1.CDS.1 [Saccharomyces cerevisiae]|nr:BDF_1d_G0038480.mRNA.1.CDS.1 [Saccharomyces cerevisiae]CAI4640462.1 BDC_1c_G0038550.mRNA.1.CDS.1 [Saccharomyces cerevisiae]CAI4671792.1 ACH_G0038550.mRNA.1.CDS.1 [Saccharomyces cerevisiae]CAI6818758.1 ACH_G0038550.mRNA.1.CDS.1 [Saccharomyces cerevisiae]CAI7251079.1 BDF_1d_G0038480.mRNA.1.CDS.1 [Saccharomyces cerevisiae]
MSETNVDSLGDRNDIYSQIFGVERRPDSFATFDSDSHGDISSQLLPNRIENIQNLNVLLSEDIANDIIIAKQRRRSGVEAAIDDSDIPNNEMKGKSSNYILSQQTNIKEVPDTKSLSSADNTPVSSPKKARDATSSHPIVHAKSMSHIYSTSNSASRQAKHYNDHPLPPMSPRNEVYQKNKSTTAFVPKRKPSLPQLALAGLKKQSSFSTGSASTTPTQARKSPLQGFGFFSRPSSKDLHEQHQHHQHIQHNNINNHNNNNTNNNGAHYQVGSSNSNYPHHSHSISSRSMSLNSSTLKNIASSFQSKTSNSRKATQKYDITSNPFSDPHHHHHHHHSSNSHSSLNNVHGSGNSSSVMGSSSNIGLGLKTRVSSTSLALKRYTSVSGTSLSSPRRSSMTPLSASRPVMSASSKKPQVYPALLSRVATKFKSSIQLGEHKKDGLVYRDAFTGQQAVDVICAIIRTSDRNLALLFGRSLDAQKLFHDVVYEHRLRDSPHEVYEFTDNSRFTGTGSTNAHDPLMLLPNSSSFNSGNHSYPNSGMVPSSSTSSLNSDQATLTGSRLHMSSSLSQQKNPAAIHNVNGVFTLLAECYSPTCTRDALCYSISCPRRLEQQARLNLKPNGGLKRNISMALDDDDEEKPSWTSSVSKEDWENLPKKEIKRQEAIYEVYITEKNFVKSLEITRDTFMKTLAETNIISADIRKNFIKHVFAHINDIYSVNRRFLKALTDRQRSSPVVRGIGDIVLRFIPFFEPFVSYVASRPYAKYLIETQRSVNPYFARFDDDMMSSSLRHGIDSFLSQGVSRPGRYMLLVKEIMKSTDPEKDKSDYEDLSKAMDALRDFMKRIDQASGAAQDRHDVKLLKQKILFKNEYVNLGLNDERRKIKHEGILSRKELSKSDGTVVGDIQFYLLDNMLLFLKAKAVNKWHQHKVFQRPIPLPLLFACPGEDMPALRKYIGDHPDCSGTVIQPEYNTSNPKNAITFLYYGAKQRYQVTLYAAQYAGLQTLLEKIKQGQAAIISKTEMFNVTKMSDRFFDYTNKINSVTSCDGGRKLLIATNSGLYMSNIKRQQNKDHRHKSSAFFSTPIQLVQRNNITQIAVLEEFKSIILLIDKKLYSCPLSLIEAEGNGTSFFKKHHKELINHVSFFAEGDCNGKRLIVTAHSSSHSIKYFEHEHPLLAEKNGSGSGNKKSLKKKITEVIFDSEPVSISFLKANLCIGCKKGFQIVSISQNAHESLLDPADTSLEFALRDTLKPMAIYRVGNMFLLCYTEFAFFVNNQGWRKKESHIIHWEGEPQKFAIWYPYILAFDSNFIEIRKIETGELIRCVLADKIRLLQTSTQEILYCYEDYRGYDTVASLDFWG